MLKLKNLDIVERTSQLAALPKGKLMINTINAHSYNVAQKDTLFAQALCAGVLLPDGASVVKACRWLRAKSQPTERIAGWDLFVWELSNAAPDAKIMFLGSSEKVLALISERMKREHPQMQVVTYSPPYKPTFSPEDNRLMTEAINREKPDLLLIGMTAPKQEKWVFEHWDELNINCHVCTIGAVFDFYAGTLQRAPLWWQQHSLEWLYRLLREPRRMWRRYLIGNTKFICYMLREKF